MLDDGIALISWTRHYCLWRSNVNFELAALIADKNAEFSRCTVLFFHAARVIYRFPIQTTDPIIDHN